MSEPKQNLYGELYALGFNHGRRRADIKQKHRADLERVSKEEFGEVALLLYEEVKLMRAKLEAADLTYLLEEQ